LWFKFFFELVGFYGEKMRIMAHVKSTPREKECYKDKVHVKSPLSNLDLQCSHTIKFHILLWKQFS